MAGNFVGAKAALVCNGRILTYLRDEIPGLPWANWWDLPGGGREGLETPEACLLRELTEEFGLSLQPHRLVWQRWFPAMENASRNAMFFFGRLSVDEIAAIRFGDEGQCWKMAPVADFLSNPRVIPEMQRRAAIAIGEIGPA